MSITITLNALADAYKALLLSASGQNVALSVPQSLPILHGGAFLCGFVCSGIFSNDDAAAESPQILERAFDSLCRLSPNTIYPERAFAVQPKSLARDFANLLRGRQYRQIYESKRPPRFQGCALREGLALKRAPSFRINLSRHLAAILRTIRAMGSRVDFVADYHGTDYHGPGCTLIYSIPSAKAPAPADTLRLPGGVWLANRSGSSYILCRQGDDPCAAVRDNMPGCQLHDADLSEAACIPSPDRWRPLEAFAEASRQCPPAPPGFRLDGSNFDFSPSCPDVVGYADRCFDLVKRMGLDVCIFRDAVFDFGTHIEDIINDTYDLFPEYRSGPKAFGAAIRRWMDAELDG